MIHVWADGSCVFNKTPRGAGGWATLIDYGDYEAIHSGSVEGATNTEMELQAIIEGLRRLPNGADVTLHSDCQTAEHIFALWSRKQIPSERNARRLRRVIWLAVATEYERLNVAIALVGTGGHPQHQRMHLAAREEARALDRVMRARFGALPQPERRATSYPADPHRKRLKTRHLLSRDGQDHGGPYVHHAQCQPGRCVSSCPVWLNFGASAYRI